MGPSEPARILASRLFGRLYADGIEHPLDAVLRKYAIRATAILDLGCGYGSVHGYNFATEGTFVVGVGLTESARQSPSVDRFVRAGAARRPFGRASLDFVTARCLLEHHRHPDLVFEEAYRMLRPGGTFAVLVPNSHHYFVPASKVLPQGAKVWITRANGRPSETVFKTYYLASKQGWLRGLAQGVGFQLTPVAFYEPPPFFLKFSPLLLALGALYRWLVTRSRVLHPLKAHLILELEKPEA